MKRSIFYIIFFTAILLISSKYVFNAHACEQGLSKDYFEQLKLKADSAKVLCKAKGFSVNYCILVDFNIHSGKERCFVWDFEKDTVMFSGLCAHGYGKNSTETQPVFSNEPGSYCSSLGLYKLGERYVSKWGIKIGYKLHGLEKTNNNALARNVVLHSYEYISETEISPKHIPLGYSQGCPVVSNNLMTEIDAIIKNEPKPLMLWIYY